MEIVKKSTLAAMTCAAIVALSACNNNDEPTPGGSGENTIQATTSNYFGYSRVVANVLGNDALHVYALCMGNDNLDATDAQKVADLELPAITDAGYAARFKSHATGDQVYGSELACLYAIVDGSIDIATEVADAKMGEPYNAGDVYGVESWYSFNSYTDYDDNIESIENSFMGGPEASRDEANSFYTYCINKGGSLASAAEAVKTAIANSHEALDQAAAKGCFRDAVLAKAQGTSSADVENAIEVIGGLSTALDNLRTALSSVEIGADAQPVIDNYVDVTVLPTYQNLKEETLVLQQAVENFIQSPTQANLDAACQQWKVTRVPWELSEAFLFGPVADQSIDPHLDSWPLSQTNIIAILRGNFNWDEEDGNSMGANTLGFHTLEFLLFENGAPRKVSDFINGETVTINF